MDNHEEDDEGIDENTEKPPWNQSDSAGDKIRPWRIVAWNHDEAYQTRELAVHSTWRKRHGRRGNWDGTCKTTWNEEESEDGKRSQENSSNPSDDNTKNHWGRESSKFKLSKRGEVARNSLRPRSGEGQRLNRRLRKKYKTERRAVQARVSVDGGFTKRRGSIG